MPAAERPAAPLRLERAEAPSGLQLVRQASPAGSVTFAATYLSSAGWAHDPPGAEGTAWWAGELAVCGAGRLDRRALARELDRAGATLTAEVSAERTEITLWGPQDQAARVLPLLADAVRAPRFELSELDRLRPQLLERLMRERVQPDRRAERELFLRLYPPGHPYRENGLGTEITATKIGSAGLRRFHDRWIGEDAASLVVTGPWSCEQLLEKWTPQFGEHRRAAPPISLPRTRAPPTRRPDARIVVPGGSQVEIRVGGTGPSRDSLDFPAAFLANELLGGRSMLSRLFRSLREARGLVYHASSTLAALRGGGYWMAAAGTDPARVDRVTAQIRRELARLASTTVGATELRRIRESALGAIALELESTSSAHDLAVDVARYDLPAEFYASWPAQLRSVGARELRRYARARLRPDRATIVAAGPAAGNSVG